MMYVTICLFDIYIYIDINRAGIDTLCNLISVLLMFNWNKKYYDKGCTCCERFFICALSSSHAGASHSTHH